MKNPTELNVNLNPLSFDGKPSEFPQSFDKETLFELLKSSTEFAADEVFWMSSSSEIIYVNNAACRKLGYEREELVGMKVWQWDPLFPQEVWPTFWTELKSKRHIDFETQHQSKDGKVFPVRIKGHYVQSGDLELLFAYVSDISELKENESKLKINSKRLKALIEQKTELLALEKQKFEEFVNLAPIGIAINRMSDGGFEYINDEFSRFTGYTVEELNAMDYWQLTPQKYETQETEQLEKMAQTGRYGPYQKEYIHKMGHTYPVLLSGIKTEQDGKAYIWSVVQDITEQVKNETAILAAQEEANISAFRLKLANDSAGIGVWDWDLRANTLQWDDWMYALYGVSKDEFSGAYEAWKNRVHPDEIASVEQELTDAVNGLSPFDTEFRIVLPSGEQRTIKSSAEILRDSLGEAVKVIGVNYDITEKVDAINALKQAKQEAEQANRAKSEFLANMSHEIRTPMNAVLGGLQLLNGATLSADLKSILDKASYSAKSLLTILNDILDYSKIEENKLKLEEAPFSFVEVLESVKFDVSTIVSDKGIDLIASLNENFVDGWRGDIVRIKQVLLNLVSNAVKFTQQGAVRIELSCTELDGKQAVRMTVIDSGIGMSPDVQSKIFERFAQADNSTTRKYGGTGLGTTITLSLIRLMSGSLDLHSEPGKGTTISVILPLEQSNDAFAVEEPVDVSTPELAGKRILIAEDNDINQAIIMSMLSDTHADLTVVENGKLAVEAMQSSDFDLVLMDIQMPEMDGEQALLEIRKTNNSTPIVALTANVMVDDIKRYLEIGFDNHIGKPIDMNTLNTMLCRYLTK